MLEDHLVQAQLIAWPESFVCALSRSRTHTHTSSSITVQGHVENVQKSANKWQKTKQKKRVQNLHYVIVIETSQRLLAGFAFVALSILHKKRRRQWGGQEKRGGRSICKRKHRRQRRARGTSLSLSAFTIIVMIVRCAAAFAAAACALLKSLDRQSSKWRGERILIERSFSSINRIDIITVESGQLNCYNSYSSLLSIISLQPQKHTRNICIFAKQLQNLLNFKKH